MDHHRTLYKSHQSHTPRQHSRINRKLVDVNRAKHRRDRFLNSRNITLSPDRQVKEELMPLDVDNKENLSENNVPECQDTTLLAKIICTATDPEKFTKQETYIKRFLDWKKAKKNVEKPEKRKPFVTSAINGATTSSLIPSGHHKGFRPPDGLKNSTKELKKVEENNNPVVKGRQSTYTIAPTPPKKPNNENANKNVPAAKKTLNTKTSASNRTQNGFESLTKKTANKSIVFNNTNRKTPGDLKRGLLRKSPSSCRAKTTADKVAKALEKSQPKTKPAIAAQRPLNQKELRPRCLKLPPPPPQPKPATTFKPVSPEKRRQLGVAVTKIKTVTEKNTEYVKPTSRQPGVIAKIKTLAEKKNAENVKTRKNSPLKSARLAQNLKAKKPLNNSKKFNLPALKVNSKKIINTILKNNEPPIQTPRDFAAFSSFTELLTSTKVKAEANENIKIEGSPQHLCSNSSAKRNILANDYDLNDQKPTKKCSPQKTKRFNFLRYSEADNLLTENGEKAADEGGNKTIAEQTDGNAKTTPIKTGPEERPANYLSPFVSVTRGKVSLKKEKEKRNSVYLQNATNISISNKLSEETEQTATTYSIEIRRTLEAVRYFRKQLQDEIDRLHQLCDVWQTYKEENLTKVQNANGEDMINVTIGQTRLLTSKKFMQFKGLIDRCEARATGIGDVECDGSEKTKTITTIDLEGFWSMLGLQVDNLDKRFDNLNRWKANDWLDPDEVKPKKTKTNLAKVKKPKAAPPAVKDRPNSALQQMLRKMHTEMRKNKQQQQLDNNDNLNDIVELTSAKQKQSNSNNNSLNNSVSICRVSVTVKDRKYFSPAATVITFSSPQRRRVSLRAKHLKESPKPNNSKHSPKFNEGLRKSVLQNENCRRMSLNPSAKSSSSSPTKVFESRNSRKNLHNDQHSADGGADNDDRILLEKCRTPPQSSIMGTSPAASGRKSILKTPGTAKSKFRNVIFNEKLRVKKFNFLTDENDENAHDTTLEEDLPKCYEDDGTQRTLTLRNRKVRLRPSCEIIIPKN